jgi:hypothetical protein
MVEVYRTNINDESVAQLMLQQLKELLPHCSCNFDLEDCDRILRIENPLKTDLSEVSGLFYRCGHLAEVL